MGINRIKHRITQHQRQTRQQRALDQAIMTAPTPAARQELQTLLGR